MFVCFYEVGQNLALSPIFMSVQCRSSLRREVVIGLCLCVLASKLTELVGLNNLEEENEDDQSNNSKSYWWTYSD